jgi:lipoate-protein ligase A
MIPSTAQPDPTSSRVLADNDPSTAPDTWRLLPAAVADGAANMALDEALLIGVTEGISPPTLRFYGWAPPCLSLGRSQPAADANEAACRAAGVDLLRRPSGGQAILHTDELTYCLVTREDDPRVTGGVLEGYRRLSAGLLAGLAQLGVEAMQAPPRPDGERPAAQRGSPVCFTAPSAYEILAQGRKLVGSAQFRAKGGILQHGSLPLHGDLARILEYLALEDDQRATERALLLRRATTLQEVLGRVVPFEEAAQALAEGLAVALNLHLEPGNLTDREHALAAELRRTRYTSEAWTGRR